MRRSWTNVWRKFFRRLPMGRGRLPHTRRRLSSNEREDNWRKLWYMTMWWRRPPFCLTRSSCTTTSAGKLRRCVPTWDRKLCCGNTYESYDFEKVRDKDGSTTFNDAEFYAFSGSKILIDQAVNDFSKEDLPCPTVIQQIEGKSGQTFFKFT